jgi:hypothetical protein
MTLKDIYHLVTELSSEELAELADYISQQRQQGDELPYTTEQQIRMVDEEVKKLRDGATPEQLKALTDMVNAFGERRNPPLNIDELKQIFADLREGFTEQDLEELEWAMNVEYIEPLDDDQ